MHRRYIRHLHDNTHGTLTRQHTRDTYTTTQRHSTNTHIYTLQTVNEMENQNRNNQVYNRVQERSAQLRRQERRSRTFEGIQPRQLNFAPDMLDNCCVLGTRVANIHNGIRDDMEGLQSSPFP